MTDHHKQPGHGRQGFCPVCERFTGPLDTCPYCDEPAGRRFSLRFLRYAALALALIGMGALYLMAAGMEPRAVDIKTITPAMNSARVRLSGQVTADARIIKERGTPAYVSFRVDDNSGEITVAARDSCARAIVAQGITPKKGDRVDVTGVVNIRNADSRRIFIESPAHLVILSRPETQRATNSYVDMK